MVVNFSMTSRFNPKPLVTHRGICGSQMSGFTSFRLTYNVNKASSPIALPLLTSYLMPLIQETPYAD